MAVTSAEVGRRAVRTIRPSTTRIGRVTFHADEYVDDEGSHQDEPEPPCRGPGRDQIEHARSDGKAPRDRPAQVRSSPVIQAALRPSQPLQALPTAAAARARAVIAAERRDRARAFSALRFAAASCLRAELTFLRAWS